MTIYVQCAMKGQEIYQVVSKISKKEQIFGVAYRQLLMKTTKMP